MGNDIGVLPRDEEPVLVLATDADETQPALSPDGRLLAYVTDESGWLDVFVRTCPGGEVRGVSLDGGEGPRWSRDGRELFFRKGDRLHLVKVTTEPEFDVSVPQELFELPFAHANPDFGTYYDVSPDGERFLVVSDRSTTEFNVILNWFEELKRLVPANP
jgi:dipeptidyl aminopeptidase/acylaminoacyl peptidase